MEEIIDILTEFAPIETLVSILAGLAVILGLIISAVSLLFDSGMIDEIGLVGGIVLIIAGLLLYVFSSFVGELLEAVV